VNHPDMQTLTIGRGRYVQIALIQCRRRSWCLWITGCRCFSSVFFTVLLLIWKFLNTHSVMMKHASFTWQAHKCHYRIESTFKKSFHI